MALHGPPYVGLMRERQTAVTNINEVINESSNIGQTWSMGQIQARADILEGYWRRFQDAQRQLAIQFSNIDAVANSNSQAERDAVSAYSDAKAMLSELKSKIEANTEPKPHVPRVSDIKLSTFTGKYTEWAAWRSEFKAKVTNSMSFIDKIIQFQLMHSVRRYI